MYKYKEEGYIIGKVTGLTLYHLELIYIPTPLYGMWWIKNLYSIRTKSKIEYHIYIHNHYHIMHSITNVQGITMIQNKIMVMMDYSDRYMVSIKHHVCICKTWGLFRTIWFYLCISGPCKCVSPCMGLLQLNGPRWGIDKFICSNASMC